MIFRDIEMDFRFQPKGTPPKNLMEKIPFFLKQSKSEQHLMANFRIVIRKAMNRIYLAPSISLSVHSKTPKNARVYTKTGGWEGQKSPKTLKNERCFGKFRCTLKNPQKWHSVHLDKFLSTDFIDRNWDKKGLRSERTSST